MKKILLLVITILIVVMCSVGCGSLTRTSTKNQSTEITLKAASFKMPSFFLEDAEQIEEFNENLSFLKTYVKEGENDYWCMNLNSFMVYMFIVDGENITNLQGYTELFYERGFRLELTEDNMRTGVDLNENPKIIIENVYCEAILSQELYEDYTGKVAVVKSGNKHICLFAGAKGRHIELEKHVIKSLDDIVYTVSTTTEGMQMSGNIQLSEEIDKEILDGKWAKVSVIDNKGEIKVINVSLIKDLTGDEAAPYQTELDAVPPENYQWRFVKVTGNEELEHIKIKVKDKDSKPFETGSRTYTVFCENETRVDAYLVPINNTSYTLEFGEVGAKGIMTIE